MSYRCRTSRGMTEQTRKWKSKNCKRGEGEKIAAAAAAAKQAQAKSDATKAEAPCLVVQAKAEQFKRKT